MYFKKLVGKKCYLSPNDTNDAVKFTEWVNDLDLTVNLDLYSININTEAEKIILENFSKDHHYSIVVIDTNEIIGTCGYIEMDKLNQTAEIVIFIGNKHFWNKGYGREALTLLIDYGFKALNLHNIMLKVYEFNIGAVKCYENIGFKHIGTRREALNRNLDKHNVLFMDLLAEDFYRKSDNTK